MTHSAPTAGTYPFGRAGRTAQWDAHAWTGQVTEAPDQGGLPEWHHGFLPFLRHRWFWAMVIGTVLSVVPAFAASSANSPRLALLCLPGFGVFMYGGVILITRHEWMSQ